MILPRILAKGTDEQRMRYDAIKEEGDRIRAKYKDEPWLLEAQEGTTDRFRLRELGLEFEALIKEVIG